MERIGTDRGAVRRGTKTHNLQTGSGNYRMVLVGIAASEQLLRPPLSVTYNGAAMTTDATLQKMTGASQGWAGIYYLLDSGLPATAGSYAVTASFASTYVWGSGIFDVVELKNVHQTNPFVVTAPVDTLDCNGMPRLLNVNFSQVGSFVYAILAARNGDVGATNTSPVGFVQTLNARATDLPSWPAWLDTWDR